MDEHDGLFDDFLRINGILEEVKDEAMKKAMRIRILRHIKELLTALIMDEIDLDDNMPDNVLDAIAHLHEELESFIE